MVFLYGILHRNLSKDVVLGGALLCLSRFYEDIMQFRKTAIAALCALFLVPFTVLAQPKIKEYRGDWQILNYSGGELQLGVKNSSGAWVGWKVDNLTGALTGIAGTEASYFNAGTAAAPGATFASDTDTGVYRDASDTLGLTAGGVRGLLIYESGGVAQALANVGSVTAPGVSFAGDVNTGLYNTADVIGFTAGGTSRGTLSSAGLALSVKMTSSATTDLGWSVQSAANQACNTTCTSACVFGADTATDFDAVACTDATADVCICAGSS